MDPQLTTQAGEEIRRRPSISPDKKYERCMKIVPCEDGSSCTFAHSKEELHHWFQSRVEEEPRLHPTKGARPPYQMCKVAESNGYCPHDVHCNFPHSNEEIEAWKSTIQEREEVSIRPRPEINPFAHYDICKNAAPCPNGLKCTFAHSEEELHVWFQTRVKDEPRKQPPKGAWPPFQKCKNFEDTGYCQFDVHCNFWHSEEELKVWERYVQECEQVPFRPRPEINPLVSYQMCKNKEHCPYGLNCTFAHSEEELWHWIQSRVKDKPRQDPPARVEPDYRMCKNVEERGYCPSDVHCHCPHSKDELDVWLARRPPASVHDDVQTGPQQKYQQLELQSAAHSLEATATVGSTVGTETNEHEYKQLSVPRSKKKTSQPGTDLEMKDAALLLQYPTEKLLNKFVVPHVIDWRLLGISLGVPANAVETIHRDEKDSRYACIRMFTQWLRDGAHQQGGGCTWKELLEAVSESSGHGIRNEIERKVTEHLALVQAQQQEQQTSSVCSSTEQFEKNAEDKPIERPMRRRTSNHAPVTPYQAESHPPRCEQDDGRKRMERMAMEKRIDELKEELASERKEKHEWEEKCHQLEVQMQNEAAAHDTSMRQVVQKCNQLEAAARSYKLEFEQIWKEVALKRQQGGLMKREEDSKQSLRN